MTLGGKERQRLPGLDEGIGSLIAQESNPPLIVRAALFAEPRVRESRMGGDDGRVTKALRGGLDEPQRDSSPERVTDNSVDAGRQLLEKNLNLFLKRSTRIFPATVTGEIDRQQGRVIESQRSPVLRAAREAMDKEATRQGFDQSDASATLASRALSRSIRA